MKLGLKTGDITGETGLELLVSTANPWLRLTGGVNGAILQRGGESVAAELDAHLDARPDGKRIVEAGTLVLTSPASLDFQAILHVVAIDGLYRSSRQLVGECLQGVARVSRERGFRSLALPALATGYGHLPVEEFAEALADLLDSGELAHVEELRLVLGRDDILEEVRAVLRRRGFSCA